MHANHEEVHAKVVVYVLEYWLRVQSVVSEH